MLLMSQSDARNLFVVPEPFVTDLMVYVGNPRETDTIASEITERIAGSRVLTKKQILKTYSVVFNWRSGFGSICLLTSLVAFVILAYDKASGLSREDLREVGILKILGWQATDVMAIRFWESAIVSIFAFLLGYSMAWVHVVWWHGVLFRPLLLGWSVLRPELNIVPLLNFQDVFLIFAMSVLPYLCATVVPAWRSAMVRPDTVI
jgi:ABC-type lipoprotein release transport system permease subunit